jgi:alpha-L-arabinofuranosidase
MNACLRRADRIKMSAIFNLVNVMGNFRVTPTQVWETPSSLVIGLMTRYRGNMSVRCQAISPKMMTPAAGNLPMQNDVPIIDAAATFDVHHRVIYLSLVNRHPDDSVEVTLNGVKVMSEASLYRVAGDHALAMNTADQPHAVQIEESLWSSQDPLTLPPHSFTLLHFQIQ